MPPTETDRVDHILAQWQRERLDLDTSPMGVIGRVSRLERHFDRELQAIFMRFGLQRGEFDVLASLRRAGQPYQLTPTELYSSLMLSSGAMTNRLDRLEQSGLIQRTADPSDRRGTLVRLTDRGLALIDQAVAAHVQNEQHLLAGLTQSDRNELAALLRKLLRSFEEA